nr:MAG TPA: hypothetical protein [Caudoviricetes sp.]
MKQRLINLRIARTDKQYSLCIILTSHVIQY